MTVPIIPPVNLLHFFRKTIQQSKTFKYLLRNLFLAFHAERRRTRSNIVDSKQFAALIVIARTPDVYALEA